MRHVTLRGFFAALVLVVAAALITPAPAFANATIVIVNNNLPGVGFNDPTPVAPVGGNPGVTLGQQRLNAFQFAADIWAATLDSNVTVQIRAQFIPLACNATGATLGSAGTTFIITNFVAAPDFPGGLANHWHGMALADKVAGQDVFPGQPDINANFNVNLGNPGCLTGIGWYLGFDANEGTQIDLVAVLLHEFGHGFGFQQFSNITTTGNMPSPGTGQPGLPDVYNRYILDTTTNKLWPTMTPAERLASAINSRHVVFTGPQVFAEVPTVLQAGTPNLRVNSPAGIVGDYAVGTASFGNPLTAVPLSGDVVLALDAANPAGPTTGDACTAITNPAAVAGKIALVDRGTCGFIVKVKNCQDAGAIAVLVADNVAGSPPAGLGGADPTITIPSVRITLPDGNLLKANLGAGVNVTLSTDPTIRAGADAQGRAHLNAPNPVVGGSSISHWDPIATPNQLMEPAINSDLSHNLTGVDLTLALMRDIGWFPDQDLDGDASDADNCPDDANPGQEDLDADNVGDVCDPDDDADGVDDADDNCPVDANSDQADFDLDGIGDACDPATGPPQNMDQCKNGQFMRFDVPVRFPNQGQCVCFVQSSDLNNCAVIKKN